MFSLDSRFSSPVSRHWVGRFFTKLHSYLHVWRSSRLRGKAIVMSWSCDPVMWPIRIISHVIWSCDLDVIPNQTATKFQHTYLVDPTKLLLMLQFYDVKAYLWSAASWGHGSSFLWRPGMYPQLLKPLTSSKPYGEMSELLDTAGSALWCRRTSAFWCPLWKSAGEVSKSCMWLEIC